MNNIDNNLENSIWDTNYKNKDFNSSSSNLTLDEPNNDQLNILMKNFGHKKFRPLQWKIISSIINEKKDCLAVLATGYGKSLCFQFPSVYLGGVTIVVSPLISLMEDQVYNLKSCNITACYLGSAQTDSVEVTKKIFENYYRLIYVTPELCTSDNGIELLKTMKEKLTINLIAIDEAHCISSWGHDFRFQYKQLKMIRDILPSTVILAMTATATLKIQEEIIKSLKLISPNIYQSGFDRPNLYFSVIEKQTSDIMKNLQKVMLIKDGHYTFSGPTIIYCITRSETEKISEILTSAGIKCLPYHAGMGLNKRKDTHETFLKDKVGVVAATIAFGMGIDKPDIRNVIHYGCSSSMENYYQEVGRAGRDGLPAKCTVFFTNGDFFSCRNIWKHSQIGDRNLKRKETLLNNVINYLETTECRRKFILNYFEDDDLKIKGNNCCDNCTKGNSNMKIEYEGIDENGLYDFTQDTYILLSAVKAMKSKYGIGKYLLFLKGSKASTLPNSFKTHKLHGSGKNKSDTWWKCLFSLLKQNSYLNETHIKDFSFTILKLSEKSDEFLDNYSTNNCEKILLRPNNSILKLLTPKIKEGTWMSTTKENRTNNIPSTSIIINKMMNQESIGDSEEKKQLYELLLKKRLELALKYDSTPFNIATNCSLMKLAGLKPITLTQLKDCQLDGFNEYKIHQYGEDFINVVRIFLKIDEKQLSIQYLLTKYPLFDNNKITSSANETYQLYQNGLTIDEIAQTRSLAISTISGHLLSYLKDGYPIKISTFNVTKTIFNNILEIMENNNTEIYSEIKNLCNEQYDSSKIFVVLNFIKIRKHLNKLNLNYEEFDDIKYVEKSSRLLDEFITEANVINNNEDCNNSSDSTVSGLDDSTENIQKKIKLDVDSLWNSSSQIENFSSLQDENDCLLKACETLEKSFDN